MYGLVMRRIRRKLYRHLRRLRRKCWSATSVMTLLLTAYLGASVYMNMTMISSISSMTQRIQAFESTDEMKVWSDRDEEYRSNPNVTQTRFGDTRRRYPNEKFLVVWYNPPPFLVLRREALRTKFQKCKYSNCQLSFNANKAPFADVVIFDGRLVPPRPGYARPRGQIWVFAAHESPLTFHQVSDSWTLDPWVNAFNWTMTYDRRSDIYLPYGELVRNDAPARNYHEIARNKSKTALWIASHCSTFSKREQFVQWLQRYIDVQVLGKCGSPWECGSQFVHDDCFSILNSTYKFFLAFENALCRDYISEKFFENYNYDLIMVTRAGLKSNSNYLIPNGTYIATDSFKNVRQLGRHLKRLGSNTHEYASLLAEKDRFKSVGYAVVYQRALCNICDRLNNIHLFQSVYKNITKWAFDSRPCRGPDDIY